MYDGWWGNSYAYRLGRAARILAGPLTGLWIIQRWGDQHTGYPPGQLILEYSPADMTIAGDSTVAGFYAPSLYPFPVVGNFPYGLSVEPDSPM